MNDILKAIYGGELEEEVLDQRLDELLGVIFDTHKSTEEAVHQDFDAEAHNELARRAAQESIVLLKNDDNILPLSSTKAKIAIIGDFARNPRYQGAGSSLVNPAKNPESFLDVIANSDFDIIGYEQGYVRNKKPNMQKQKAAVELAKRQI